MKRFKKSIAAWGILLSVLSFWGLYFLVDSDSLAKISYSLTLGVLLAVMIRYTKDAFLAAREGRQGYSFLIVGLWLSHFVLFWRTIWGFVLVIYERPAYLVESPTTPFLSWLTMIAAALVAMAPDVDNGKVGKASLIRFALAVFVAGVISGVGLSHAISG